MYDNTVDNIVQRYLRNVCEDRDTVLRVKEEVIRAEQDDQ